MAQELLQLKNIYKNFGNVKVVTLTWAIVYVEHYDLYKLSRIENSCNTTL